MSTKKTGYSKRIVEANGVFMASFWAPDATEEEAQALGTFGTQVQAERALEDAIVAATYRAEQEEADDKLRREQWEAEQERVKAHNDRHEAARSVPDHEEPKPAKAEASA